MHRVGLCRAHRVNLPYAYTYCYISTDVPEIEVPKEVSMGLKAISEPLNVTKSF